MDGVDPFVIERSEYLSGSLRQHMAKRTKPKSEVPTAIAEVKRDRHEWVADLQSSIPSVRESAGEDLSRIVFRIACAYLHRRGDVAESEVEQLAEDVAQEALVDILSKLDSFRAESKFTTWVYQFVNNNARELLRKRSPSESRLSVPGHNETATLLEIIPDPQVCTPLLEVEENDLIRAAQEVINTCLTERQRLVLLLCQAGYTRREIAERINATVNNVYQLLHAARKKLKKELHSRGYGLEYTRFRSEG
jgi:RNA polymerase sigma-70 factor (ECF subfamily)